MKKKGFIFFLIIGIVLSGMTSMVSFATELDRNTNTEMKEESRYTEVKTEEIDGTEEVKDPEESEETKNIEEIGLDSQITHEDSVENIEVESLEESEEEQGFHGERNLEDEPVTAVDENGNVFVIDDLNENTIVEEGIHTRTASPQIVNLRKVSGVLDYTEVATGVAGYTHGSYGADAAYLGTSGGYVTFMLSGVIGKIPSDQVQVVNKSSAKSVSYYAVSNGRLNHYITTNINSSSYSSLLDNGPSPSYLSSGIKYYSYDGHYFYTESNFGLMLDDYNNGTRTHSVNPKTPFYNYFQYLPLRSKSSYGGSELTSILNNRVSSSSKMKNIGNDFVNSQNTYGVNALLMVGVAANESAWGTSNIAQTKNNLFGLNAVDSSPGQSANYFSSVSQCIKEYSEIHLSEQYLNPQNWKHFGAFLGNKASGMNVKYASDPYWGEKAAAMAWSLDKANGEKDADQYTIGIKDTIVPTNIVNVRKDSSASSTRLYQTKENANCAFLILDKSPVNGFYKIQSEPVLNSDRTSINSDSGVFDFNNMYAFISSEYVQIVSTWAVNGINTSVSSPQLMETDITLSADVNGESEGVQYKFVWMKDNWTEWGIIQDFSEKDSVVWTPDESGTYTLFMNVSKPGESTITVEIIYVIKDWSFKSIKTDLDAPRIPNIQIYISAEIGGKKDNLKYKFVWMKDDWTEWGVINDFSLTNGVYWTPQAEGDYHLYVNVQDQDGFTSTKEIVYEIVESAWKPSELTASISNGEIGKPIDLTQNIDKITEDEVVLQYKFVWMKDNWAEWGVIRDFETDSTVTWTPQTIGECEILVDIKDDRGNSSTAVSKYQVLPGTWSYKGISADKESPNVKGESVNLSVDLAGNVTGLTYKFVWMKDNWAEWGVIRDFSTSNTVEWKPSKEGIYTICIDIKDKAGKVVTKEYQYEVLGKPWKSADTNFAPLNGEIGENITITQEIMNVLDEKQNIQYKFVWMKNNWSEWGVIRDFSTLNSVTWTPEVSGKCTIFVNLKDDKGNSETKEASYTVQKGTWMFESILVENEGILHVNKKSILKTDISGNTSGLEYKYVWMKNDWREWGVIKDFSQLNTVEWSPITEGRYNILVDVKDTNGEITTFSREISAVNAGSSYMQILPSGLQNIGAEITIKAGVDGTQKNVKYKYVWMKDNWAEWGVIQDFSASDSVKWIPTTTGNYTLIVNIKAENQATVTKETVISINDWEPNEISTVISANKKLDIYSNINGNSEGFMYKYVWMKDNWAEWGVIQDFSEAKFATWMPKESGKYIINVDIKDMLGNTKTFSKEINI